MLPVDSPRRFWPTSAEWSPETPSMAENQTFFKDFFGQFDNLVDGAIKPYTTPGGPC